jgi:hypothetical protein
MPASNMHFLTSESNYYKECSDPNLRIEKITLKLGRSSITKSSSLISFGSTIEKKSFLGKEEKSRAVLHQDKIKEPLTII